MLGFMRYLYTKEYSILNDARCHHQPIEQKMKRSWNGSKYYHTTQFMLDPEFSTRIDIEGITFNTNLPIVIDQRKTNQVCVRKSFWGKWYLSFHSTTKASAYAANRQRRAMYHFCI